VVVNVRVEPPAGSGLPLLFVTITVTVAVLFRVSEAGGVIVSPSVTFSNWKAPMSTAPVRGAPRASVVAPNGVPAPMARLPGKRATVSRVIALSGGADERAAVIGQAGHHRVEGVGGGADLTAVDAVLEAIGLRVDADEVVALVGEVADAGLRIVNIRAGGGPYSGL